MSYNFWASGAQHGRWTTSLKSRPQKLGRPGFESRLDPTVRGETFEEAPLRRSRGELSAA